MSVQTLYTAATGMTSLETKLDVISNNLANVNTTGFKKSRANFEDLFYRHLKLPGTIDGAGRLTPVGISVGLGSKVSSTQLDHRQGAFSVTGKDLDLAIAGKGFFQVLDTNGQISFTRAGNFSVSPDGTLVAGSAGTGRPLEPAIQLPPDYTGVAISAEGAVSVQQAGNTQFQQSGQIQLAQFANPEGLVQIGENLYQQSDASGAPVLSNPGTQGVGLVRQGTLELSNVEPVQELIDLITTQRSFELNSQAVQAGDQILQLVSNLRRF